jgi:cellobiose phosphorylase
MGIVEEQVPYDNQPGSEQPFYEHLQRSLSYTSTGWAHTGYR